MYSVHNGTYVEMASVSEEFSPRDLIDCCAEAILASLGWPNSQTPSTMQCYIKVLEELGLPEQMVDLIISKAFFKGN